MKLCSRCADFVVLDMEEDLKIPLLLGCPFHATGRALIDVQKGQLTLRINEKEIRFNIYKAMKMMDEPEVCKRIDMVQTCIQEVLKIEEPIDSLELALVQSIDQKSAAAYVSVMVEQKKLMPQHTSLFWMRKRS